MIFSKIRQHSKYRKFKIMAKKFVQFILIKLNVGPKIFTEKPDKKYYPKQEPNKENEK